MPSEKLMSAPHLFSAARLQLFGEATLMDLIRILVVFETMSGGDDVVLFIDESIPKFYGTPEFPRNMFSALGELAHQLGRRLAPQSAQDIFSFISQGSNATSLLGDMFMNVLLGASVSMIQKAEGENDHEQVNAWAGMSEECYVEWRVNMDTFSTFNEQELIGYSCRLEAPAFKKEESVDSDKEKPEDSDAATGDTDFSSGIFQSPTSGLPSGDNSVNHAMYDNKM